MDTQTKNNLSDHTLVEKVLHGDRHAFGQLIKSSEGLVAQILFKMIPHAEDRRDLVQDVYLKVYKNLGGFRFESKLSTWIGQITYTTALSHLEKKKLWLPGDLFPDDQSDPEAMESLAGSRPRAVPPGPENLLMQKERAAILVAETEKLSGVYRTLIALYHQEGLSYEEIAEITGLPIGTVKSYLFRARKMLKNNLLVNYKKEEL